jgi:hypothetical protein
MVVALLVEHVFVEKLINFGDSNSTNDIFSYISSDSVFLSKKKNLKI